MRELVTQALRLGRRIKAVEVVLGEFLIRWAPRDDVDNVGDEHGPRRRERHHRDRI